MERRFSMNDFEQSLKEHADEFKMIPSKRVWHGIYNDLHPGRRWPSIAMSLLLIFTLVIIGHLNTHTGSQSDTSGNVSITQGSGAAILKTAEISRNIQKNAPQKNFASQSKVIALHANHSGDKQPKDKTNSTNNYPANNNLSLLTNNLPTQKNIEPSLQSFSEQSEKNEISPSGLNAISHNIENNIFEDSHTQLTENSREKYEIINGKININNINSDILNSIQQISIENNNLKYPQIVAINKNDKEAVKNKTDQGNKKLSKPKRKKNAKISWVYFVAPQLNSVLFNGEPIRPVMNASNSPAVAINQKEYKVLHNSAPGFEAGIQINYTLASKLGFTSGLHITYSGYNITSNEVHPTFANLLLKDPETGGIYSKSYITHFGDGTGQTPVTIRNYSLQASLPIGLQYELFGSDKVQLNAAADFEPSMIIKSNAYLLSSDGNNYVNDPDLLRKLNMSSNFGVFVTFLSSKFKWQIGPNVRYQWLSTYKKDYPIQEHLIDYGIRIGMSPIRK